MTSVTFRNTKCWSAPGFNLPVINSRWHLSKGKQNRYVRRYWIIWYWASTITAQSGHQKHEILNKHFRRLGNWMEFPQFFLHGCNKSCKSEYLSDNFVCSKLQEEVHCIYGALFLTEEKCKNPKSFVSIRYSGWHNILEEERKHDADTCYLDAIQLAIDITQKSSTLSTLYQHIVGLLFEER